MKCNGIHNIYVEYTHNDAATDGEARRGTIGAELVQPARTRRRHERLGAPVRATEHVKREVRNKRARRVVQRTRSRAVLQQQQQRAPRHDAAEPHCCRDCRFVVRKVRHVGRDQRFHSARAAAAVDESREHRKGERAERCAPQRDGAARVTARADARCSQKDVRGTSESNDCEQDSDVKWNG